MDEFLQLETLENGAYELANPFMTEATRYAGAEFNRLYYQGIRLPEGKSNVVYLLSPRFDSDLRLVNNTRSLIIPSTYRKIYFPVWGRGMFMKRRYTHSVDKKALDQQIRQETKFAPYASKTLISTNENILFAASGLYETVKPILEKSQVKQCYSSFWFDFVDMLGKFTPAPKSTGEKDGHRFVIIDAGSFPFSKDLKENKLNPLYLLYLAFMRNHTLNNLNIDMNLVILSGGLFLKINPMQISQKNWSPFKTALNRIINVDLGQYTDNLPDEEKREIEITSSDQVVQNVVNQKTEPFTTGVSSETRALVNDVVETQFRKKVADVARKDQEIKVAQKDIASAMGGHAPVNIHSGVSKSFIHQDPVQKPLDPRHAALFKALSGYQGLADETDEEWAGRPEDLDAVADDVGDDVQEILTTDQEVAAQVMDIVQDKVLPMKDKKKAPINSARDAKLREEQKKVAVKTEPIEKILEREATNVPIEEDDHSAVLHTSNPNMKRTRFINFEKTYLDKLYNRDIVACFMSLSEKEHPFYITKVDVKDTSTSMNLQETWTVGLKDEAGRNSTVVVDLPRFQNDRFMWLEGVRYVILKQNFYNPLVKDTPDTVICRTNYNTVTIDRVGTKSMLATERIFSLIKKTGDVKMFMTGDSSQSNMSNLNYINSLEYDELSRRLFRFSSGNCELFFSRDYIKNNLEDQIPSYKKGNEFYIGHVGQEAILIDEDTGLDRRGRTITQIIEENLPAEYVRIYESIKAPKQTMYVQCKIANEKVPIICPLIVWNGITNTLNTMGIDWEFKPGRVKQDNAHRYVRFRDGYLVYTPGSFQELILNGLVAFKPEQFAFEEFNSEVGYLDYIFAKWGSYRGITQLNTFKEFLVDPITKDVCRDMNLPQDPTGLLLHAVKLLCDNSYVSKASDVSYRVRSIEIIPAILNECLAKQYQIYVSSGGNIKMTLSRRVVINNLLKVPTVKGYSTLNPVVEMSEMSSISSRGYKGTNSIHAYRDEKKRSYDPTSIGKLAMSTSPDANVGVTRSLTVEPTISNARGYREPVDDIHQLKDVNILSPVEMLTPGTALGDDPIRTAIACKQSGHVVPVKDASPALVSNGYDEAVQFSLSNDFVINAEENGKVIEVNDDVGFIMVQYDSGKTQAINIKPDIVRNSASAFYLANQMKPTHVKVGEKFKKDEPLAYHDRYFRYSPMNGLRYAIGPLAKVAFMSMYNTYEDAGVCTAKFGNRMTTKITYCEEGKFKRNHNIISMVNVGDHVNIGDPLIKFDVAVEDDELAKYISRLSDENAKMLEEETKNEIKTNHAGTVIDIKVYSLLEPEMLSPSLGKIVKQYFQKGIDRKEYLSRFDASDGIIKAGYMLTDSTEPVKHKYNHIKGHKGLDVLIEVYIEHDDVMGVGDKVALYGPNKQIISEMIPEGYEPYSEFRPDEEISVMTSPGTIARRMTASVMPIAASAKICVELKRKIKDMIQYR